MHLFGCASLSFGTWDLWQSSLFVCQTKDVGSNFPDPGIQTRPCALGVWSLKPLDCREVPVTNVNKNILRASLMAQW